MSDHRKTNPFAVDQEAAVLKTPERELWFAVIERALKDYCFFFDKILTTGNGHLIRYDELHKVHRQSFNLKAIAVINRLRWFLFEKQPVPFNLTFLLEQLYDDDTHVAAHIREQAAKQFKLHCAEIEARGMFQAVISYVTNTTEETHGAPSASFSTLKTKRYRKDC